MEELKLGYKVRTTPAKDVAHLITTFMHSHHIYLSFEDLYAHSKEDSQLDISLATRKQEVEMALDCPEQTDHMSLAFGLYYLSIVSGSSSQEVNGRDYFDPTYLGGEPVLP